MRAFELHVEGRSLRQIAKSLGVDRSTVATDIAMEGQRRAHEFEHQRKAQIEMSNARFEAVLLRALNRIAELTEQVAAGRAALKPDSPDRLRLQAINAAERTIIEHERVVIQTLTKIDELFGLTYRSERF